MNSASKPERAQSPISNQASFSQKGFAVSLPGEEAAVRGALKHIVSALKERALADEEIGTVELVLAEVLNNVVEHAYGESEEGEIEVTIRRRNQSIIFEICDDGRPMPNGRPPAGSVPDADGDHLDSLPEGGFGWLLIRELVRDLIYDRRDDQNILIFRYRLED